MPYTFAHGPDTSTKVIFDTMEERDRWLEKNHPLRTPTTMPGHYVTPTHTLGVHLHIVWVRKLQVS